jgi:hypothetical protein
LYYNPLLQLPTAKDREAGDQLISRVKELPGEVFIFTHGFYSYLAGKTTYFSSAPYGDIMGGASPQNNLKERQTIELTSNIYQQMKSQQVFNWVILDSVDESWMPYYVVVDHIFDDPAVFFPVTGSHTRPQVVYVKNPIAHGGDFPLLDSTLNPLFSEGWSLPQSWGRWITANQASLNVSLEQNHAYQLALQFHPNCAGGQPVIQELDITWNGQVRSREKITNCDSTQVQIDLAGTDILRGFNNLGFELSQKDNSSQIGSFVGITSMALSQR